MDRQSDRLSCTPMRQTDGWPDCGRCEKAWREENRVLRAAKLSPGTFRNFARVLVIDAQAFATGGARRPRTKVEPDILLLDLTMPDLSGLEVLRKLSDKLLPTPTIILAASIERYDVVKALQVGARGLVMKDSSTELLLDFVLRTTTRPYMITRMPAGQL
jgi:DNA-binding NarL/FixJ family response regulator